MIETGLWYFTMLVTFLSRSAKFKTRLNSATLWSSKKLFQTKKPKTSSNIRPEPGISHHQNTAIATQISSTTMPNTNSNDQNLQYSTPNQTHTTFSTVNISPLSISNSRALTYNPTTKLWRALNTVSTYLNNLWPMVGYRIHNITRYAPPPSIMENEYIKR